MNVEKLSSDEVPQKFMEWLLSMGCPPEKVPSVEKISEMCRGQYYMVWRSLMEHVEPKATVRRKRLQVFYNDVQRCEKKTVFNKHDSDVVEPEELTLWKQQTELKDKLSQAETQRCKSQKELNDLMDKVSSKMAQRNSSLRKVKDTQRRVTLLQSVIEELKSKKSNLEETKSIANSLCCIEESADVESKLDKCMSILRRNTQSAASTSLLVANPVASSSVVSTTSETSDTEEHLLTLVKCRGDELWPLVYSRRAALAAALCNANTQPTTDTVRVSPQSVLSHTAALHCTLALEAMKNKAHVKQTRNRLANAVTELNNYLTGEACELLVLRCERARSEARVKSLRIILDELTTRRGVFSGSGHITDDKRSTRRQIATLDTAIENKREELKKLVMSLAAIERKIQNVKECLVTVFNGFNKDLTELDSDRYRGVQIELPSESVATLRHFYEDRRERQRNKVNISLDISEDNCSLNDTDYSNPKFTDELRLYLKKFNLDKNRKIILENGEKLWIFETLQSSLDRFHSRLYTDDIPCSLVCPSICLSRNVRRLIHDVQAKEAIANKLKIVKSGVWKASVDIDVESKAKFEEERKDEIKKRINNSLLSLQKINKTIELTQEHLKFWRDNQIKKYISNDRKIDGKTYKEYEAYYKELISVNM